jgi:putative transposase
MPWVKVWLHFVWSTKERYPYLTDEIRNKVFEHIRQNARGKGIHIDFINGYVDHIHCLISLGTEQTLSWIMQSIKGESSFWINKNKLTKARFAWQDEYFVVAVNEKDLPSARRYIAKQEEHHKTVSFDDEFEGFLRRAGFQRHMDSY